MDYSTYDYCILAIVCICFVTALILIFINFKANKSINQRRDEVKKTREYLYQRLEAIHQETNKRFDKLLK